MNISREGNSEGKMKNKKVQQCKRCENVKSKGCENVKSKIWKCKMQKMWKCKIRKIPGAYKVLKIPAFLQY